MEYNLNGTFNIFEFHLHDLYSNGITTRITLMGIKKENKKFC